MIESNVHKRMYMVGIMLMRERLMTHVETCVLLSRETYRQPDARVKIDVELEDYYAIKDMKKSGE